MGVKTYSVSLEEKTVENAKELYQKYGTKLSSLLNELLANWCKEERRKLNNQ